MNIRLAGLGAVLVVAASLAGCASLSLFGGSGPHAEIVQHSKYCGTRTPQAALHYFADPNTFGSWIDKHDIRELRPAAASLAGVLVVEMGQRPSDGYGLKVNNARTTIENHTLDLYMDWSAPGLDAQVAQVMISPCFVIPPPKGDYDKVVLRDQRGKVRGKVSIPGR